MIVVITVLIIAIGVCHWTIFMHVDDNVDDDDVDSCDCSGNHRNWCKALNPMFMHVDDNGDDGNDDGGDDDDDDDGVEYDYYYWRWYKV